MFIGNAKTINLLNKAIQNSKVSHAYLFSGPESVGKFFLAKIFARSVIRGTELNFKDDGKVLVDILILKPEIEEKKGVTKEKEIKVEHIRNVQKNLSLFPYDGKYKVLIINDAHKMSVSAQNSLLKILEEPNETSIIILVTHDDSKIISTIKSRCQRMNFSLVDLKEIEKIADNNKDVIKFSMGRPGLVFKILENEDELDNKIKELEDLKRFSDLGINERLKLAEKMSSDSMKTIQRLEFWTWIIRLEALENSHSAEFFSFKTIEKIEKSAETIKSTNANTRFILENLFLEI